MKHTVYSSLLFLFMMVCGQGVAQDIASEAIVARKPPLQEPTVAFPKFSPMPVFSNRELLKPVLRNFDFGTRFSVIEETLLASHLRYGENSFWVHRADIMTPPKERYLITGPGFSAKKRPVLRFWRSLGLATEFLSATDVRSAAPDLEEVRIKRRIQKLKLPILVSDTVDVMGARPVQLVAIMLPVFSDVVAGFDELRGAQLREYEFSFLVDASPDAVNFAAEVADSLYRRVSRFLRKSGDLAKFRLTLFGANFWSDFEDLGFIEGGQIKSRIVGPMGPVADHEEPLLNVFQIMSGKLNKAADKRVLIVLSGANIAASVYSVKLKRQVNLSNLKVRFPDQTAVFIAQITPEPGQNLRRLSKAPIAAQSVAFTEFSENLSDDIFALIVDVLGANTDRPLNRDDLTKVCNHSATSSEFPCILPYAASTSTRLPRPTRRGATADWFSTIVWVVNDGLILKEEADTGH